MKASDILKAAKKLLEKNRWMQFRRYMFQVNPDGTLNESFCSLGAIDRACSSLENRLIKDEIKDDVLKFLVDQLDYSNYFSYFNNTSSDANAVAAWNDNYGRTKLEILEVFDKAYIEAMKNDQ